MTDQHVSFPAEEMRIRAIKGDPGKAPPRTDAKEKDRFESLLDEVSRNMKQLEGEAAREDPEAETERPEALQDAFARAGRNFESAIKTSRHLVEAYRETIANMKTD